MAAQPGHRRNLNEAEQRMLRELWGGVLFAIRAEVESALLRRRTPAGRRV